MKSFLSDEYDSFLDTDEFAESVTIGGTPVDAHFIEQYVEVNIGGVPIAGVRPTLEGKHSDFTGNNGATVVHDGSSYTIVAIQPQDTGWSIAILQEA